MKFRLLFQRPPNCHWVLMVRHEDDRSEAMAKILYPEWRDKTRPPPYKMTLPDAQKLRLTVKAALAIQRRR